MNEQEMQQEIERLRRELAEMTKSRNRLCDWFCQFNGFKPLSEEEIEELKKMPGRTVDELMRDILPADMHHLVLDETRAKESA